MRWTLLLLIGLQSCAPMPIRDPNPPAHILIPLSVKRLDLCGDAAQDRQKLLHDSPRVSAVGAAECPSRAVKAGKPPA
jgi:hypothetical protein